LYNKLFPTWRGPRRAVLPGLSCPRPADGPGRWRWHEDADSKVATAPLQATEMDGVRAGRRHTKWWVAAVAARCRTDATLMVLSGCFARAPCHLDIATFFKLPCARRCNRSRSWLALRRRDLVVASQRAGQSAPRPHCGSQCVGGACCTLQRLILPMWATGPCRHP